MLPIHQRGCLVVGEKQALSSYIWCLDRFAGSGWKLLCATISRGKEGGEGGKGGANCHFLRANNMEGRWHFSTPSPARYSTCLSNWEAPNTRVKSPSTAGDEATNKRYG